MRGYRVALSPGTVCTATGDGCLGPDEHCGNGVLDRTTGEQCDDGNKLSEDGCSAGCTIEGCGNGVRDVGEACDDGNEVSNDGCSGDCLRIETCGDGGRDPGEVCDDGNEESGDGCSADCLSNETCGNGYIDAAKGEVCDDGGDSPDCDDDCTVAMCGDGLLNEAASEQCDNAAGNSDTLANACRSTCLNPYCGDGVQDTGEICDGGDGTTNAPSGAPAVDTGVCNANCTPAVCGDSYRNSVAGEICDEGGDTAMCDGDCTLRACGDRYVNRAAGEDCDDGNGVPGDGCNLCHFE